MLQPVGDFRPNPLQGPHVTLQRQVAATVAVLLHQVLPDPLSAPTSLQRLRDRLVIGAASDGGPVIGFGRF